VLFDSIEQLLLMISTCEGIVGFEIFGSGEKITIQFVCPREKASSIKSLFQLMHREKCSMRALILLRVQ
jgi:hypothetical protein